MTFGAGRATVAPRTLTMSKTKKSDLCPEDLSLLLEADLPTILAASAASTVDRNEGRLGALLALLRHRVLKLIRSRENCIHELQEFSEVTGRLERTELKKLFPWFLPRVVELAELLLASEECVDWVMAIKRHLPFSWDILEDLHAMKRTPILYARLVSQLCGSEGGLPFSGSCKALSSADLIHIHDYSYPLGGRPYQLAKCDAHDAIDHVRDNEDPPRIPVCGKCGSDMRVLDEKEADAIRGLTLVSLTDKGADLMVKVKLGRCVF